MRKLIKTLTVTALLFVGTIGFHLVAEAADGGALYTQLKCGLCHKPDKKAAGVALSEIARVYGEPSKLAMFFKGKQEPKIESTNWGVMAGQMPRLEALSEEDQQALAGYILSFR
jgi:cytochrome c551/c552